jgi:hypothetical protein
MPVVDSFVVVVFVCVDVSLELVVLMVVLSDPVVPTVKFVLLDRNWRTPNRVTWKAPKYVPELNVTSRLASPESLLFIVPSCKLAEVDTKSITYVEFGVAFFNSILV